MGMDVHGLNPKQNKNIDDFPIFISNSNLQQDKIEIDSTEVFHLIKKIIG